MTMRLGLAPKQVDKRTLRYRALRAPGVWRPPAAWSWDGEHPGAVPVPMFANDRYGDCVIAARAHQTLRFEAAEVGAPPPITDEEVVAEYFAESGGIDAGLVMLQAMRAWRAGWVAGGATYTIHSFLEVVAQDHDEVREAMVVGTGLQFGARLPLSAADQMGVGAPWDLVAGPRGAAGSWGGHAILACEYDAAGVTFITWGKRQRATWAWVDAYADECYLAIDDVDRAGVAAAVPALPAALAAIR